MTHLDKLIAMKANLYVNPSGFAWIAVPCGYNEFIDPPASIADAVDNAYAKWLSAQPSTAQRAQDQAAIDYANGRMVASIISESPTFDEALAETNVEYGHMLQALADSPRGWNSTGVPHPDPEKHDDERRVAHEEEREEYHDEDGEDAHGLTDYDRNPTLVQGGAL